MEKIYEFLFANKKYVKINRNKKCIEEVDYDKSVVFYKKKVSNEEAIKLKKMFVGCLDEENIMFSSFVYEKRFQISSYTYSRVMITFVEGNLEIILTNEMTEPYNIFLKKMKLIESEKKKLLNIIKETENSEVKRRRM